MPVLLLRAVLEVKRSAVCRRCAPGAVAWVAIRPAQCSTVTLLYIAGCSSLRLRDALLTHPLKPSALQTSGLCCCFQRRRLGPDLCVTPCTR